MGRGASFWFIFRRQPGYTAPEKRSGLEGGDETHSTWLTGSSARTFRWGRVRDCEVSVLLILETDD